MLPSLACFPQGNYDQYVKTRLELEENQMKRFHWEQDQIAHMKVGRWQSGAHVLRGVGCGLRVGRVWGAGGGPQEVAYVLTLHFC